MTKVPFFGVTVLDAATHQPVENADVQVYDLTDTGHTTPLAVWDAGGAPVAAVRSGRNGLASFQVEDRPAVRYKSGTSVGTLSSPAALRDLWTAYVGGTIGGTSGYPIQRHTLTADYIVDPTALDWPTDQPVTWVVTQPATGGPYSVTYAGSSIPVADSGSTVTVWVWDGSAWRWGVPTFGGSGTVTPPAGTPAAPTVSVTTTTTDVIVSYSTSTSGAGSWERRLNGGAWAALDGTSPDTISAGGVASGTVEVRYTAGGVVSSIGSATYDLAHAPGSWYRFSPGINGANAANYYDGSAWVLGYAGVESGDATVGYTMTEYEEAQPPAPSGTAVFNTLRGSLALTGDGTIVLPFVGWPTSKEASGLIPGLYFATDQTGSPGSQVSVNRGTGTDYGFATPLTGGLEEGSNATTTITRTAYGATDTFRLTRTADVYKLEISRDYQTAGAAAATWATCVQSTSLSTATLYVVSEGYVAGGTYAIAKPTYTGGWA